MTGANRIFREISYPQAEGNVPNNLGLTHAARGNSLRALSFFEAARNTVRTADDLRGEVNAFGNLGNTLWEMGEIIPAVRANRRALVIFRKLGTSGPKVLRFAA